MLARQFAQVCAEPGGDPFDAPVVVVQNAGMARWLSLRVADELGISANLEFLFPAEFSWSLMRMVIGDLPETAPFSPGPLAWRILGELENHPDQYPELKASLEALDQQGLFQLARQLERLFDQYLFYRPHWIERWESGEDRRWQARLWRALRERSPDAKHWLNLQDSFRRSLDRLAGDKAAGALPRRVLFFGISELSPGYLGLLRASAEYMDIHFFVMNPCRVYWGDIEPEKIVETASAELQPYLEKGNTLLASLGRQGRDFFDLMHTMDAQTEDIWMEPDGATLLAHIQKDILNLVERPAAGAATGPAGKEGAFKADGSLLFHSCHTPMREVEVLHDQLLAMLERDPHLTPSDIIVMAPSMADYAPAVEAVFGSVDRLRFSIADQALLSASVEGRLFRQLLDIADSRYEVSRILDLVEAEPLQRHFGLDQEAVDRIRDWCERLRVRWGIDADMRRALGFVATGEHSWRAAMQRLLLGCMMDEDALFQGILPYTDIEGSLAVDAGNFTALLEKLFGLRDWRDRRLPVREWMELFTGILNDFVEADDNGDVLQSLRDQLARLTQQARQAGYEQNIEFSLARKLALDALETDMSQSRFLSAGVTFCELTPMRSVPFRVVCLLGMNDGAFPRNEARVGFDLMADSYHRGDRSSRVHDRYLFLESLLAARQRFYVSWVGQDVVTNDPLPPSVLVAELLDVLESEYGVDREALVTQQPLQAFSRRYLENNQLFTYADFGLVDRQEETCAGSPFLDIDLLADKPDRLDLAQLERFIIHPVRFYLGQVLGLARHWREEEMEAREPFEPGRFDVRDIRRQIAACDELPEQRLRAQNLLPHGIAGEAVLQTQIEALDRLRARLPDAGPVADTSFSVEAGGVILAGALPYLREDGLLMPVYDKPWVKELLIFWLRHLAAQVSGLSDRPGRLVYPEGEIRLEPPENASEQLAFFIAAFVRGQSRPLHFMPKSALAWADKQSRGGDEPACRKAAQDVWNADQHPESADLAYDIAFRGENDLFNEEFARLAGQLWGGYLTAGGIKP